MINIVILIDTTIERYPPVIALLDAITKDGEFSVDVIEGESDPRMEARYRHKSVRFFHLYGKPYMGNLLRKAYDRMYRILRYRAFVNKYLQEVPYDIIWVATADTALHLRGIIERHRFILNLFELYDHFPDRLKQLRPLAARAQKIVVPEANRANILRVWFDLPETPAVIPNKPSDHPLRRNLPVGPADKSVVPHIRQKILLYQGHIIEERRLDAICEAAALLPGYCLVLMGKKTDYLARLQSRYPHIIHQDYISPPHHLAITSHAHIGIVTYTYESLNNIFCAPNKIWEYAGFGIPMLGNDIPGLQSTIGAAEAGLCVNTDSVSDLSDAIRAINARYVYYCERSDTFYHSVSIDALYKETIHKALSR